MSDDELDEIVARWMRFAEEDAEAARRVVEGGHPPRHACWAAQQAAEKALKALLSRRVIAFPKTHSLRVLNDLLPAADRTAISPEDLNVLSEWAVEARYPGPWPDATREEAERATQLAERVVASVRARLSL